ncbi:glycine zipper 2TM domain-containing protein [Halobacteria archaeon AArc-dxtr1]|nr:glycine zipper 2TM domain-containing protein [Halobacteria archaeon AArc-dxtr1]
MGTRIRRMVSRARYAAIGAAVGAAVGGLVSRNAASTGGAIGGLIGAIAGETRVDAGTLFDDVKERANERRGESE